MKQYFVRYQFGGGKQPKKNITVEAKNKPDAYKKARLSLPAYIVSNVDFHFTDCTLLANESVKANGIKGLFYSLELTENPYSNADKKRFFELQHTLQIDICKQIVSHYSIILSNKAAFKDYIIKKGLTFQQLETQLKAAKEFLSQWK